MLEHEYFSEKLDEKLTNKEPIKHSPKDYYENWKVK